jgi:hypothetical protein
VARRRFGFKQGTEVPQSTFGDPVTATSYVLCLCDDGALAFDIQIPAGMLWLPIGSKGYLYRDPDATSDGVLKARLLGVSAGGSKLKVKGKGANVPLPGPVGATYFNALTDLRVQLHGNGSCWDTTFSGAQILRNDPHIVKAKY